MDAAGAADGRCRCRTVCTVAPPVQVCGAGAEWCSGCVTGSQWHQAQHGGVGMLVRAPRLISFWTLQRWGQMLQQYRVAEHETTYLFSLAADVQALAKPFVSVKQTPHVCFVSSF